MAIAFTACVNDEILQEDVQNNLAGQPITVTAYAAETEGNPVTRIDQGTEGTNITLSWSDDDNFSVIRGSENQTFTKATGDNIFEGTLPEEGSGNYYAVYPVTTATDCAEVPFDISNQTEGLPYLMYSTSATGESYQFSHAVAYLKVTFPETLKNTTSTIVITTPENVKTDGTLNLTDGTITGGTKNTITKVVTFEDNTDVMFAIPAMAANNKTLKFLIMEGANNYSCTLDGTAGQEINAGNYYTASASSPNASVCNLPKGINFKTSYLTPYLSSQSGITVKFKAQQSSIPNDATPISLSVGVKLDAVNKIFTIYTTADVFVFDANCRNMFSDVSAIIAVEFGDNINTSSVTDMSNMFYRSNNLTSLNLSNFNTTNVTDMSSMFLNCSSLASIVLGDNFTTSSVENMSKMFSGCSVLESINDLISSFSTDKVKNMSSMFGGCTMLTLLNLSNWNTSNVTNMSSMFQGCSNLESIVWGEDFTTSSVTNMNNMFDGCSKFTSLDLSSFKTDKVESMKEMFKNCSELENIIFGNNFDTGEVTTMYYMFGGCSKLKNIILGNNFDTEKVTTMYYMFGGCSQLQSLDLTLFNTENVENMSSMFYACKNLEEIEGLTQFNTAEVKTMESMFNACEKLTSLNLSSFNTTALTTTKSMFLNCYALETITFGENFKTESVTNMNQMFNQCKSLEELDLSKFSFTNVSNFGTMFSSVGANGTSKINIFVKTEADKSKLNQNTSGINYHDTKAEIVVKQNS